MHLYELVAHPEGLDCVQGAWKVKTHDTDRAANVIQLGKYPLEK